MKLTEFTEQNQLDEAFLSLNYDMWGWIDPSGKVHLPTRRDATDRNTEVYHSTMIQRFGFSYGYYDAFSKGWIRWYLSNGNLTFNCDAHPHTAVAVAKATRQIETMAKNPKKFNYFNGREAKRAADDPGGMLLINQYTIEIKKPYYEYFSGPTISKVLNELKDYMTQEGIEQKLKETASAGATSSGGIGTGFVDGIGDRKRMAETHKPGHSDHEVSMAHSDAQNLVKNAAQLDQLLRMTSEQQGLPGWVSAYITLANDYIENVTQYLTHHQDQQFSGADHE